MRWCSRLYDKSLLHVHTYTYLPVPTSYVHVQGAKSTRTRSLTMFMSGVSRSRNGNATATGGPKMPSSICLMKYFSYRNSKDMCGAIEGPIVFSSQLNSPSWKFHLGILPWKATKTKDKGVCFCTRHESRYEYTALEADTNSHERLELERKARQRAESACLHYLRFCPRYALIQHLNDIGSRVGKHWFVVKDSSIKTERLLTLTPQSQNSPIIYNQVTRRIILDLFLALQHPYIYPILDLEFIEGNAQNKNANIIVVLPFNNKGSLKDLIYKTCWHDEWSDKYGQRSKGLPLSQVQRLGRQILEALLFLREREYTFSFHLHSGNIILQNGVARLSGLENPLLGFTSRIQPVILKSTLLQTDPSAVDVICFGHVLFEMAAGYELTEPEPTPANMLDVAHYPHVVEILEFVFKNPKKRIPSVEELLISDFFRSIDLREMRAISLPVLQVKLTSPSMALLNKIKDHQLNLIKTKGESGNENESENAACTSQQIRYTVKIQKHKSCEAPSQPDINCITECQDEDESYCAMKNSEEHRSLNLHQRKLDVTLLEMQTLCRN
ncbi:slowpoke-binding protein isoform X2 [Planococcus citri]|uniref:slowpoke-binding protein isoform X2 n=1 Tax=Planococcus citri TaxID=170843 RepID=UPI0031F75E77